MLKGIKLKGKQTEKKENKPQTVEQLLDQAVGAIKDRQSNLFNRLFEELERTEPLVSERPLPEKILEKKRQREDKIQLANCPKCNLQYQPVLLVDSVGLFLSDAPVTQNHMQIVPLEHCSSRAEVGYSKGLQQVIDRAVEINVLGNKSTILLEYCNLKTESHFLMDSVPIAKNKVEAAKSFFSKALEECDKEWTDNKKVIETFSVKGDVSKLLSSAFPYVHVNFDGLGGYLHIIEDYSYFTDTFMLEILSPLLQKTVSELKYPKRLGPKEMESLTSQFKALIS